MTNKYVINDSILVHKAFQIIGQTHPATRFINFCGFRISVEFLYCHFGARLVEYVLAKFGSFLSNRYAGGMPTSGGSGVNSPPAHRNLPNYFTFLLF